MTDMTIEEIQAIHLNTVEQTAIDAVYSEHLKACTSNLMFRAGRPGEREIAAFHKAVGDVRKSRELALNVLWEGYSQSEEK